MSNYRQDHSTSRVKLPHSRGGFASRLLRLESLERREVMNADLTFLGDINTTRDFGAVESYAQSIPKVGDVGLVALPDKDRGTELWRSDGTVDGTSLLKDIAPGAASSNPSNLTAANGRMYFTATGESLVEGIWKTDGTSQGTAAVFVPRFGYFENKIRQLTPTENGLFFICPLGSSESDLRVIRANDEVVVVDSEASQFRSPYSISYIDGFIILRALDAQSQEQGLFSIDTTTLEVQKLGAVDFATTLGSTTDRLYWITFDESFQQQVWMSDGTRARTRLIPAINSENSTDLAVLGVTNNRWILARYNPASEANEIISINRTGEVRVLARVTDANAWLKLSIASGNKAVLTDGVENGSVWLTDGTPSGTKLTSGVESGSTIDVSSAIAWKGDWVVPALSSEMEQTWYRLDSGTGIMTPIEALNEASLVDPINTLKATDAGLYWYQPTTREMRFTSDGIEARTLRESLGLLGPVSTINQTDVAVVADDSGLALSALRPDGASNLVEPRGLNTLSSTRNMKPVVRDGFVFTISMDAQGTRLWKSDGTAEGTSLVSDNSFRYVKNFLNMSSTLLLIDQVDEEKTQYWTMATDGSLRLQKELDMVFEQHQVIGDSIFASNESGLWFMETTQSDPVLLLSTPDLGLYFPLNGNLRQLDRLYFPAVNTDGTGEIALWTSDGTLAGTVPVAGGQNVTFEQAIAFGGSIYFIDQGRLFKTSDGFATQTKLAEQMALTNLQVVADTIYFTSTLDNFQTGVWRLLEDKPQLVTSFNPSGVYPQNPGILEVNGRPYYFGNDPSTGRFVLLTTSELSDGLVAVPPAESFGSGFAWQLVSLGEKIIGPQFKLAVGEELFALDLKPTAVDDRFTVNANESIDQRVMSNDYLGPKGGSEFRFEVVGLPTNGRITVGEDGIVEYVPSPDFVGTDEWSYQFFDNAGVKSNVAVVTVNVISVYLNTDEPLDVNGDGDVTPLDPLRVINFLNLTGSQTLPQEIERVLNTGWIDTDGNGQVSPLDALRIINSLNLKSIQNSAEGESRIKATDSWMASFNANSFYDEELQGTMEDTRRARRLLRKGV